MYLGRDYFILGYEGKHDISLEHIHNPPNIWSKGYIITVWSGCISLKFLPVEGKFSKTDKHAARLLESSVHFFCVAI